MQSIDYSMNVELLSRPPVSGSIPERWFDAVGDCAWVRFSPSNAPPWAGVFGAGDVIRSSAVIPFADGRHVLVMARGRGYVVDAEAGIVRYRTSAEFLVSGLTVPERDFVVACSWTHLYAFGNVAELWTACVALDGIELRWATPTEVRGEAWQGAAWHGFTISFDGWRHLEHGVTRSE